MILLAYRHGLRASELVDLRWEQVDFKSASLAMRRLKNGTPSTHPLTGRELRELRRHQRESPQSPFVFVSERGAPLSRLGFAQCSSGLRQRPNSRSRRMRTCCATPAGSLAKAGVDTRALQAYLGHRNIQHTVRYTELAPDRFKDFWRD